MKLITLSKKITFSIIFSFCLIHFSFGQGNTTNGGEVGYDQTIYEGEQPEPFVNITSASGGDPSLDIEYQWLKFTSLSPINLEAADGVNNQETYSAPPLFQNTYYERTARREGFVPYQAGSNLIIITVLPGNVDDGGIIAMDQTVMINEQPDTLFEIEPPSGGNPNVDFEYEWVKRILPNATEEPADGVIDQPYYIPPPLTETTIFKRKARRAGFTGFAFSNQVTIEVEPTSIENIDENIFQIYPNPVTNYLQIEFKENSSSNWQVEIFDIIGKLKIGLNFNDGKAIQTINLQKLQSGTYLVHVINLNTNESEVHTIIKN